MTTAHWLLVSLLVLLGTYATFVALLFALGRGQDARAIGRFVPDCVVLLSRLMREPDVPRRRWLVLVLVVGYLGLPFDIVPDFLPVVGYLDDAVVVILTFRWLLRSVGADRLRAQWPGPDASLEVVLRLAGA